MYKTKTKNDASTCCPPRIKGAGVLFQPLKGRLQSVPCGPFSRPLETSTKRVLRAMPTVGSGGP